MTLPLDRSDVQRQFAAALQRRHLSVRGNIQADGKIHRCDVTNKGRHGVGDGSYLLHLHSNFACGGFQNFCDGKGWQKWNHKRPGWKPSVEEQRDIDDEIERARANGEQELAKARAEARLKANRMWDSAATATAAHPYCRNKQVVPEGLRQITFPDGTSLLVPLHDDDDNLITLQMIRADGSKTFLRGGRAGGCCFWIARPRRGQPICICEGWATGQSISAATEYGVVVAFDTGNLGGVAEQVRQQYPDGRIIICADDDWKTAGNPGTTAAWAAARAVKGFVAVPRFKSDRKDEWTDFNDMVSTVGDDAVKRVIDSAIALLEDVPPDETQQSQQAQRARPHKSAKLAPDKEGGEADKAAGAEEADSESEKQADRLVRLAASADLFHDADHVAYADIQVNGHRETYPTKSRGFKLWLTNKYYRVTKSAPSPNSMSTALAVIEARAIHDAPQHDVFLRIAGHDGRIYLDLCDADWRVVEIDAEGWRDVGDAPVRFIRRRGMLALPVPEQGGSLTRLRHYINVATDADFILACAWPLGALRDRGPYPVSAVNGEAGTAKSTTIKVLRALTDPNKAPLRAPPREDRDLFIAASNAHAVSFDNLSEIRPWLSDSLARLSTGGGFATRQLYSDDDERLFEAMRPVLLGAIANVIIKGDLADRAIRLELARIPDSKRRREEEFWQAFERDRPAILGALLDAIAHGLRQLPNLDLTKLPRMADFTAWVVACGDGLLWEPGEFVKAYAANRSKLTRDVVDADAVASAVQELMAGDDEEQWSGTATELLTRLGIIVGDKVAKSKGWPTTAAALGGRLKHTAPQLRQLGIDVVSARQGKERVRTITLTKGVKVRKSPSAPSAPSANADSPTDNPLRNGEFFGGRTADRADRDSRTSTSPIRRPRPPRPGGNGARPPQHDDN